MSSQNNNSKKELSRISNYILSEQNIDITSYTAGHLNENHLWKPKELKTHQPWPTASSLLSKSSTNASYNTIITADNDIKLVPLNQLKSSFVVSPRIKESKSGEEFKLPLLSSRSEKAIQNELNIKTDKEIAFDFLKTNAFKGATKEESFKNLRSFERDVLKKSDLVHTNVLHPNDYSTLLEKRLNEELTKIGTTKKANISELELKLTKVDLAKMAFEQIILETVGFEEVFERIKNEYETYLNLLIRQEYSETIKSDELTSNKKKYLEQKEKITQKQNEIEYLEELIEKYDHIKSGLVDKIQSEKDFYERKLSESKESALQTKLNKNDNVNDLKSPAYYKISIGEKIEVIKGLIIEKLDYLQDLNESIKNDYVPVSVINNFNQSIKEIDIEIQKLIEQIKFYSSQEEQVEKELKDCLRENDKTEFSEDNVEELLKWIKNLTCLKLENQTENVAMHSQSIKESEFDNIYNDYFS